MYTVALVSAMAALVCFTPSGVGAQDSVPAAARYADVAHALTPLVERAREQHAIPGISIALVDGSRVIWARGFGWADSAAGVPAAASTVYRVGSVSKLFTDIGIMQLVERGDLSLDAPVTRYLPEFHPRNPFGGEITLRQLTSHRSGLTREPPVGNYSDDTEPSLAATVASLNHTTLVYRPGAHTKYSNAGIAVLGYVFNAIANQVADAEWLRALSPYSWAYHEQPLTEGADWGGLGLLWGLSIVLVIGATLVLRRRDITG
jgi:CubicO group peptidase (beta-lactamase class C family)